MTVHMMKLAAALLLAFSLVGCAALGPTTPLNAPGDISFRNADAALARTQAPPAPELATWWRGFDDPELTRLVEAALTANLDVAQAEARLNEADALVRRSRADRLPGGWVNASVARQRQSLEGPIGTFARNAPGFTRDQTVFETGAQASWEVDLFGRLGAAARAARSNRVETAALLDGVRVRIAAETADAFLALTGANERLRIVEAQRDVLRRLDRATQRRFDAGEAGLGEVEEARGDLARVAALVPVFSIEAEAQRNRLRVLTAGGELAKSPDAVPRAPGLSGLDSPGQVLRRRPDVRAAEARVAASDARIGSALAEYYPSISIAGVIGFQALDSERLFTAPALNAQGLVGLRWRLFDFARIDAEVAAARARGDGAAAAYRAALLLATEDVENALFALVAREQQAREAARASVSFTSASRAAKRTFDAGITGLPQLLDAERRSLGARQDEADARLAAARAAVASFRAIGGVVGGGPDAASSADPRRSQ